jgi:hypothetical protein
VRVAVAADFGGFAAIEAMSWQDYALARQYLAEKYVGSRLREAKAVEDAKAAASRKALGQR